jgi:hypothetical protein
LAKVGKHLMGLLAGLTDLKPWPVAYGAAGLAGKENPSAGRGEAIAEGRQQRIEKELVTVRRHEAVEQRLGKSDWHETGTSGFLGTHFT